MRRTRKEALRKPTTRRAARRKPMRRGRKQEVERTAPRTARAVNERW
jgi:hypothetical protein